MPSRGALHRTTRANTHKLLCDHDLAASELILASKWPDLLKPHRSQLRIISGRRPRHQREAAERDGLPSVAQFSFLERRVKRLDEVFGGKGASLGRRSLIYVAICSAFVPRAIASCLWGNDSSPDANEARW
jgi:fructose-1-phosphate kinase PfkB-like protein